MEREGPAWRKEEKAEIPKPFPQCLPPPLPQSSSTCQQPSFQPCLEEPFPANPSARLRLLRSCCLPQPVSHITRRALLTVASSTKGHLPCPREMCPISLQTSPSQERPPLLFGCQPCPSRQQGLGGPGLCCVRLAPWCPELGPNPAGAQQMGPE